MSPARVAACVGALLALCGATDPVRAQERGSVGTATQAVSRAELRTPEEASATAPTATVAAELDEVDTSTTLTPPELEELFEDLIQPGPATSTAARYTAELSDRELERRWREKPASLGPISIGFVQEGRLINAVRFPPGDGQTWVVMTPEHAFGTRETIDQVLAAARRVKRRYPNAQPLRVNAISAEDGGYVRPHRTHQSGRDVDLGLYYDAPGPIRVRAKEKVMNVAQNWELLKALLIEGDVQVILLDRRVQKVLRDHARSQGEDPAWLSRLFDGPRAIVQHARGHRDHFHVRYYNARAQELGRRVAPLLALRPEENLVFVRVRRGDTLGGLAQRHGSTVAAIRKQNRLRSNFLRVGQVLRIQRRGPCTDCPVPPPTIVPPRCTPPEPSLQAEPTLENEPNLQAEPSPVLPTPPPVTTPPVTTPPVTTTTTSTGAETPLTRTTSTSTVAPR